MARRDQRPRRSELARYAETEADPSAGAGIGDPEPAAAPAALRPRRPEAGRATPRLGATEHGFRVRRTLGTAQRVLLDVSADALTRCHRAFAALEVIDPPGPATGAADGGQPTAPGATLPGRDVLSWYKEASRTVLGMTEAQLRREQLTAGKRPGGPGASADASAPNLSDAELLRALLETVPTADLASALRARGADVIDLPPGVPTDPEQPASDAVRDDNG